MHGRAALSRKIDRIVVLHDFPFAEGGAGVLAITAAREYLKRGIPVTFFSGAVDQASAQLAGCELAGVDGRPLLALSRREAIQQGLHNSRARDALRALIAEQDTPETVYHLHNWSQVLSPAIFEALHAVDDRLVVTCHDFFNVCPNGSFTDFPKSQPCKLQPMSAQCTLSNCDRRSRLHKFWRLARHAHLEREADFGNSRATYTFLHERMREKFLSSGFAARDLVTVPNPVEPWSSERIRAEDNSRFLFVGRVARDKGADIAARAADDAGVPLTIAGSGELEGALGERSSHVRLAGWCDREKLRQLASGARALVVPSRVTEPFGLVILEAAMSGLPVIVSDRAYLSSDVEELGFGERFAPDNGTELAEIMARLGDDDGSIEAMSRKGFEHAQTLTGTPSEWADEFLRIFESKLDFAEYSRPLIGSD